MKSREDFAFRRPDFGVERSVTTRVRYPDERFQELLDLTYGKVLQFLVSTARISDVADEYQGQKLQKSRVSITPDSWTRRRFMSS